MRNFYLSKLANTHDIHHKRFIHSSTGRITGGSIPGETKTDLDGLARDIIEMSRERIYEWFEDNSDDYSQDIRAHFLSDIYFDYIRRFTMSALPLDQDFILIANLRERFEREREIYNNQRHENTDNNQPSYPNEEDEQKEDGEQKEGDEQKEGGAQEDGGAQEE